MNLAVCIITSARANYLYVTLDAVFNMPSIEAYPVYVFCGGKAGKMLDGKMRYDIADATLQFPVTRLEFARKNYEYAFHQIALKSVFDQGYDYVLFLEDDIIIRPDSLEYIERIVDEVDGHLYALHSNRLRNCIEFGGYNAWGVVFTRPAFEIIFSAICRGEYLGMNWPDTNDPLGSKPNVFHRTHDAVYGAIARKYRMAQVLPDKCYAAHIGLISAIHYQVVGNEYIFPDTLHLYEPIKEMESRVYSKPREEWLPTIVDIIRNNDYDPSLNERLLPRDYIYID